MVEVCGQNIILIASYWVNIINIISSSFLANIKQFLGLLDKAIGLCIIFLWLHMISMPSYYSFLLISEKYECARGD